MNKTTSDAGMALVTAMLVLLLTSSLLVGFAAMMINDQKLRTIDRGRSEAFYAAHAGLEQLTTDLGQLFSVNPAPAGAQINALTQTPPSLPGVQFVAPTGGSGYTIQFPADAQGNPVAQNRTILSGPWQGFVGLATPYTLQVTARLANSAETSLRRTLQTVSIPVFQFGTFSETDLSFFAGPAFNFGGRVHTNGNLFLASGNVLTMSDKVTAVGEVVRTHLSNGWATNSGYTGQVRVITTPGAYRALGTNEGSLVTTLGSAQNEPTWSNLSTGTYNHNLSNGRTGAKRLDLPIVSFGAQPVDLVRRPPQNEDTANQNVFVQRYFSMASLRVLVSDTAADILNLPTVTPTAPVPLGNLAVTPVPGYAPDAAHPPFAISSGVPADGYRTAANTPLHGGFLKIEMQTQAGAWQDVTIEILNLGIAGRNLANACAEPNANAIIRIERVRDNPASNAPCGAGSTAATDYWPNVLYDAREGDLRDNIAQTQATVYLGGVMHYVEVDVRNLSRWFQGAIGASGMNAMNLTGYVLYFSDRRNNRDAANQETGEYGFEDFVNPASGSGSPNGVLNTGEDVNASAVLDTYGQNPIVPAGGTAPLDATARPWTAIAASIARVNRPLFYRRAVKLTNGSLGNIVSPGLTVASENPVYVEGNFNASNAGFANPHVATAVISDSITLLSTAWNDRSSFTSPHNPAGRIAATTWYRVAIIAGKGPSFAHPGGTDQDFGTDGGAHNFLRYLENWNGRTLNYRGAVASLYYSRQAVGTYKCCTNVYSPPTRAYNFDTDFLQPALLPPRTPMFRDVNTTGFTHVLTPQ